jgi:hypothetical protein
MASPASIVLSQATFNGTSLTLTATVTGDDGNPYSGASITISGDDDFSELAGDNGDGTYSISTSYTTAITVVYSATDESITSNNVTVVYTGPVLTTIYLINIPTEFDGTNVDLEIRVKDQMGAPFPGASVTLNGNDGSSATSTTDEYGSHTFNISKSTAATVIYTGICESLTSETITIIFTGGGGTLTEAF